MFVYKVITAVCVTAVSFLQWLPSRVHIVCLCPLLKPQRSRNATAGYLSATTPPIMHACVFAMCAWSFVVHPSMLERSSANRSLNQDKSLVCFVIHPFGGITICNTCRRLACAWGIIGQTTPTQPPSTWPCVSCARSLDLSLPAFCKIIE